MSAARHPRAAGRGFTLTELVIAMAILAILVTVAVPSYRTYIVRTNRATARTALMDLDRAQEAYFLRAHAYATSLDPLLGTTGAVTTAYIDSGRKLATSSGAIYQIDLCAGCGSSCTAPTATAFGLKATPMNAQATGDTQCTSLCLTSTGQKSATGTASDCWER